MKKVCTINEYDLYFDEKDGYSVVDGERKVSYSLLEGKTLAGTLTSDIIFIMKDTKYDAFGDLETQEEFINYFYGASAFPDPKELLNYAIFYINRKN